MNKLKVTLSNDKMLAYVSGEMQHDILHDDVVSLLNTTLLENGIVFGVQEKLVGSIIFELLENRKIDDSIIAIGEYPKPEKLAGVRFLVPTYLETAINPEVIKNNGQPVQYYQLKDSIADPYIVHENETVGKLRTAEKGTCGHNVLGEEVAVSTKAPPSEELGQGLMTDYDSPDVLSTAVGVIIRKKNGAYILPVNTDGAVFINVSKDRLKAYLHLLPAGPGGKEIAKQDILKVIQRESLAYGLQTAVIQNALDALLASHDEVDGELIAEGKPPVPGIDARVEYQVDLSFSQKPNITDKGRADYYSLHLFENVVEKQPLAKILPPTDGIPGVDVYGITIPAPAGRENQLLYGKNVTTLPNDPSTLISTKTGHVYVRDNNLLVEEVLRIESDVDFHTGNIDFIGDIIILGDIKSGFSVKAAGSISVKGTIEDAIVEAGESVIAHAGFIGKGNGRIKAGRDVVIKHVRNQTIMAKNNIMIDGESLDANIYAGNEMFVEIKKSWIVGGTAVARNKVQAYALGNESHTPTEVSAGIDLFVKKILEELEKEIIDLEKELNIIASNEQRLSVQEISAGELESEKRLIGVQLKRLREEHEKKISQLQKYKSHYKRSLYDTNGTVGVIDTIYPGVIIKIGNKKHIVQHALKKCLFYVYEDEIKSRSFSS